jgi:GAF domain-containing protein
MVTIEEDPIQSAMNEVRFLRTTKVPINDLEGKPRYLLGISEDITERKAAEAERDRLLNEVETAIRRYVAQEWDEFLTSHHQGSLRFEHQQPGYQIADQPTVLKTIQTQVLQDGETQIVSGRQNQDIQLPILVAPVTLRNQVIGTLSLEAINSDRIWTAEEAALVEAVAFQLALTVENLRLVDATQRRAAHETAARQITDKLHNASDIESILNTAVSELSRVLSGSRAFIELQTNLEVDPVSTGRSGFK